MKFTTLDKVLGGIAIFSILTFYIIAYRYIIFDVSVGVDRAGTSMLMVVVSLGAFLMFQIRKV